jgi:hypothetical protein
LSVNINNQHEFTNNKRDKNGLFLSSTGEREKEREGLGEDLSSPAQRLRLLLLQEEEPLRRRRLLLLLLKAGASRHRFQRLFI